ncbi:MAG: Bro-N domain-containing protein [Nanoarchaeota archaeon]|nr:Bro-N domain-containing protein [Nanoarchaeota archaeon]
MESNKSLVVFQDKKIRRIWHNEMWYFSVSDIILVLTDSKDALAYWRKLKQREPQLVTICHAFKLPAEDEKLRFTDCANTESMFRIIQSIPSKKAEPFKRWLAKVGYERVQEIEDPELAQKRMKELYKAKGYSDNWIEKRVRGIAVRQELTDEWKKRNIKEGVEFGILTNQISKATFGKTVEEYKKHKGLQRENLRDHMHDLELIFTMLGEKVTTEITKNKDAQKFNACSKAAKEGGGVAGRARIDAEKRIGKSVVSKENYLTEPEKNKRKQLKYK